MDVSKNNLEQAIAAAREAVQELDGFKHPELADAYLAHCVGTLRDLLAALDAARGEAATVTSSNTAMTFSVVTPGFPDGTKLYAAPPAALAVPVERLASKLCDAYFESDIGECIFQHLARRVAELQAQQPAAAVPEDAFSALLNCASRTAMLAAARKGVGNEQ